MKLSSRVDYALSCVLRVADRYGDRGPVSAQDIAKKESLEIDYVEQLLITMKRAGILKSVRGRDGGYMLAVPPGKISADNVMEAIEEELLELVCFRKKGRRNQCLHLRDCRVRKLWIQLGKEMKRFLKTQTIEGLLRSRKGQKNW
jgi:Rrf2 family protein